MRLALTLAALLTALPAMAEAPRVVATIAPVHALVARVMAGVGTPDLLIQPGVSEHDYALRPSEAAELSRAQLVFEVGAGLERGLSGALASLAPRATVVRLADAPGVQILAIRGGALFEADAHDDDHGSDDHAADDHAPDAHGASNHTDAHGATDHAADGQAPDAHGKDDHAHGADDHDHEPGAPDPHLWLDPANARAWVDAIAAALAQADPEHGAAYAANAAAARGELDALQAELAASLAPLRGRPYIVFHDAFQYFEHGFDLPAAGAIAFNDAALPGAQRIAQIRARLADAKAACVFAEPQSPADLVATVIEGTGAKTGSLDPLGAHLTPGPELYPALLRDLARALHACLG